MKVQELINVRCGAAGVRLRRSFLPSPTTAAVDLPTPTTSSSSWIITNPSPPLPTPLLVPPRRQFPSRHGPGPRLSLSSRLRSLLSLLSLPTVVPTCRWLSIPTPVSHSLRRKITGTLFGHRKGHVTLAVQDHPRSDPVILIELPTTTFALVKEMSSGLVRIALECHKSLSPGTSILRLYNEPLWTMYCNGTKRGYATSRPCSHFDLHVLRTVQAVSIGAGVIPQLDDPKAAAAASEGELLYMRARFERVVGTRDSEAFYMLNPDGDGGPDLSIFLLRL